MTWLLTAVLCIVVVEIVVRLPFKNVFSQISRAVQKSLRIVKSKTISDHWKEKVMLAYAGSLFAATMALAGLMLAVGAVVFFLIGAFDYFGTETGEFIVSWVGIVYSVVVATVYVRVRMNIV